MTPAEKLKEQRKLRKFSCRELSEKSGINLRTLQNWEIGRSAPNKISSLVSLAESLECKISDLLEDDLAERFEQVK